MDFYSYEMLAAVSAVMSLVKLLAAVALGIGFFYVIDPITSLIAGVMAGWSGVLDFLRALTEKVQAAGVSQVNPQ